MSSKLDGSHCPLCFSKDTKLSPTNSRTQIIACPRCGSFSITMEALSALNPGVAEDDERRMAASSWLREHPDTKILEKDLQALLSTKIPPVGERAEKLLAAISADGDGIGSSFYILFGGDGNMDMQAASWCADKSELQYLLNDYLVEEKRWVTKIQSGADWRYVVSPKGHDHLDSLRRATLDSASGFCAMWFDPMVSGAWENAISPAIQAAGYKATRIDKHEHVNRIDDEIMAQIRRSKFVVADFTGQRHSVYFEAGFAIGLGIPVIWTVREDELHNVHFDNRQYNFILWTDANIAAFRDALTARIVRLFGQGPIPL